MKNGKENACLLQAHSIIVSCQALADEPLHGSEIMSRMALAAKIGGASGIRANTFEDIKAIREVVDLPIIGLVKRNYPGFDVYITPTLKEVDEVYKSGADIVAIDATNRPRPDGQSLATLIEAVRKTYPTLHIMADVSTLQEGLQAESLGVDLISTTLSGYTEDTRHLKLPNIHLVRQLSRRVSVPIIAEGGIRCPKDLQKAFKAGAHSAVIGSAITRPQLITRAFVEATQRD